MIGADIWQLACLANAGLILATVIHRTFKDVVAALREAVREAARERRINSLRSYQRRF